MFHDEYKLDTVFDAGGRVSLSLTAVTVTSQLFFPGDFLTHSTFITKVCLSKVLHSHAQADAQQSKKKVSFWLV